jgi:hypothetical protein
MINKTYTNGQLTGADRIENDIPIAEIRIDKYCGVAVTLRDLSGGLVSSDRYRTMATALEQAGIA